VGSIVAAAAAASAYAYFEWPRGALVADVSGIARVVRPSFGASTARVSVKTADGATIPVRVHSDGTLWPRRPVAPGTRMAVEVVFRRPGWVSWIAGRAQRVELDVTAPRAHVEERWLRVESGAPVRIRFDRPVRDVELTDASGPRVRVLSRPARTVVLGRLGEAGSVGVAAVERSWEQLPPPVRVTWFPPGRAPRMLVSPVPGSRLGQHTPIRLTFSDPVARLFHRMPRLTPPMPGRWRRTDAHTLVFAPRGYGFGLDAQVKATLPVAVEKMGGARKTTRHLTWATPTGSELRLQQLLAELGYLPLRWQAATSDVPPTLAGELAAAVHPPAGRFTWRYPSAPASLVKLWTPGRENVVTRGAVMAFESSHDLPADGLAGRRVWRALIADVVAGRHVSTGGYTYVVVHRDQQPQTLTLWRNGQTLLTTPANTGIPAAPTVLGTFPVYARFTSTTMSGTSPDGSHYSDPGVPWVSYFNGGDAVHGFNRASYGTAQSLGCVELPPAEAARVWPYMTIGTLVTISR
jgi:peptidoglycan hydrolase-like protein with peptidoglycan-binding domain